MEHKRNIVRALPYLAALIVFLIVTLFCFAPQFEGKVLFHRSFGYVAKGEPIIYNNELNNLDLSLNEVSMGETYGISYGPDWTISIWK